MKKGLNKLSELSIFFPAYNEAGNIEEAVAQALNVLPFIANKYEVIIVDDGSEDSTFKIGRRLAKNHKEVRIVSQPNKGYGGALKRGFRESKFEWIFFTDSDLQFDVTELKKLISHTTNSNLIIGYRIERAEGWKRQLLALSLKLWNRLILNLPNDIKDIDCAFKLIHKNVINEVEPLFSDGAMISTELLLKAHKANFTFTQVGVHHYKRLIGKPTGNNIGVIYDAIFDTFYLKRQLLKQDTSLNLPRINLRLRIDSLSR